MRKSSSKATHSDSMTMKKGGCQWEVAFGRGGSRPPPSTSPHARGGISIQRHVADLQIKILSKDTFKIGVAILRSLMRDRYSSASRSEQRQLYSLVSRVATILGTQFTGEEFWTVGLSLFKAAKRVITQVDELMHILMCIDLSHKFLGDDRQRNLEALATISGGPSVFASAPKRHAVDHRRERTTDDDDDDEPLQQESRPTVQPDKEPISEIELAEEYCGEEEKKEELLSLLNHSEETEPEPEPEPEPVHLVPEPEPEFPVEDPDLRLARILTMEELSMEIQAILYRVNRTFAGQSHALADEFIGLQEAIQATLQITSAPQGPPPAAKEEIEKLSIVTVTKHVLTRLGEGTQCAVCREPLIEGDIMQEMPCLHSYHPGCLRPWLEKHNSCPICRFELRTEDEDYEKRKQQDHNAKEQRRHIQIALKEEEMLNM